MQDPLGIGTTQDVFYTRQMTLSSGASLCLSARGISYTPILILPMMFTSFYLTPAHFHRTVRQVADLDSIGSSNHHQ